MTDRPPLFTAEDQPYLGLAEIATLCGVEKGTTWRWQQRDVLPAPDFLISERTPAWSRDRIVAWGVRTGRMPSPATAPPTDQQAQPDDEQPSTS